LPFAPHECFYCQRQDSPPMLLIHHQSSYFTPIIQWS